MSDQIVLYRKKWQIMPLFGKSNWQELYDFQIGGNVSASIAHEAKQYFGQIYSPKNNYNNITVTNKLNLPQWRFNFIKKAIYVEQVYFQQI